MIYSVVSFVIDKTSIMKRLLGVLLLVILIFTSCIDSTLEGVNSTRDFSATIVGDIYEGLEECDIAWEKSDQLTIFSRTTINRKYQIKNLNRGSSTAKFEYCGSVEGASLPLSANYGLYPYDAEASISGDIITTTLPTIQSYEKGSFYRLMVAKSNNTNLAFKGGSALMKITLSKSIDANYTLRYITLTSLTKQIAGRISINLASESSQYIVSSDGYNDITLADINVDITAEEQSFYIAMPSGIYTDKSLLVTLGYDDGVKEILLSEFSVSRGAIKTVEYNITTENDFTQELTPRPTPSPKHNKIYYEAIAKVVPYNTNAFDANIISNDFDTSIREGKITFDKDITQIGSEAFNNCDLLLSVTMPDRVTEIGSFAFARCINLRNITIPNSVTDVGEYAFLYCYQLSAFNSPLASADKRCLIVNGVLKAFASNNNNNRNVEYIIPNNVTEIGNTVFYGCSSFVDVVIPNKVTKIGNEAFAYCSYLERVNMNNSVVSIGKRAFYKCNELSKIVIPDSVTSIGNEAFCGCSNMVTVTIGTGVKNIGSRTFFTCYNLKEVYCKPIVPPAGVPFEGTLSTTIYVPRASLSSYRTSWNHIAGNIMPYDF